MIATRDKSYVSTVEPSNTGYDIQSSRLGDSRFNSELLDRIDEKVFNNTSLARDYKQIGGE